MRARAEGITVIGPRCESEQGEQGCETRGACETRETSEGRASDTKKGSCTGSARADLTLGTWCYDLFPFLLIYFLFCLSLCAAPCFAIFAFLCACFIAYLCVVLGHILHDT